MIRTVLFNKVVSALNDLRLKLVVETKHQEDRESIVKLFDIAFDALYASLKMQKK